MKPYSFDTLVYYVLKDLRFKRTRVLVVGQWYDGIDKPVPGSTWKITFYFERMFKGYVRQVEKLSTEKILFYLHYQFFYYKFGVDIFYGLILKN